MRIHQNTYCLKQSSKPSFVRLCHRTLATPSRVGCNSRGSPHLEQCYAHSGAFMMRGWTCCRYDQRAKRYVGYHLINWMSWEFCLLYPVVAKFIWLFILCYIIWSCCWTNCCWILLYPVVELIVVTTGNWIFCRSSAQQWDQPRLSTSQQLTLAVAWDSCCWGTRLRTMASWFFGLTVFRAKPHFKQWHSDRNTSSKFHLPKPPENSWINIDKLVGQASLPVDDGDSSLKPTQWSRLARPHNQRWRTPCWIVVERCRVASWHHGIINVEWAHASNSSVRIPTSNCCFGKENLWGFQRSQLISSTTGTGKHPLGPHIHHWVSPLSGFCASQSRSVRLKA